MRSILRCNFSTPTNNSTSLYSGINTLYAQNPVFEIIHDESVKVYPHMYNGNVQQNPLCVESCVTKKFSMSSRFSSTIFDPDANSVLLRGHLCTAVDSMRRKPCVRNCWVYQKLCTLTNKNNKLAATNTFFSTSKGGISHTYNGVIGDRTGDFKRIDYILTRQAHRPRVHNVEVYLQPNRPIKVDSDYNMVFATVDLGG